MKHLGFDSAFVIAAVIASLLVGIDQVSAQSPAQHRPTFRGKYDAEFSFPTIEGKAGQKDPGALQEIDASVAASGPADSPGIQMQGAMILGGNDTELLKVSLDLEIGNRYRMDIERGSGQQSVRFDGYIEAARDLNGQTKRLPGMPLGERIIFPSQLKEFTKREDVLVIDDGNLTVAGQLMHKITVVYCLFPPFGTGIHADLAATSFYFDPVKHYLLKSVAAVPYVSGNLPKMLKVITYSDYRTVQGMTVPFAFFETNNGQPGMTLKASEVLPATQHDNSYFRF